AIFSILSAMLLSRGIPGIRRNKVNFSQRFRRYLIACPSDEFGSTFRCSNCSVSQPRSLVITDSLRRGLHLTTEATAQTFHLIPQASDGSLSRQPDGHGPFRLPVHRAILAMG